MSEVSEATRCPKCGIEDGGLRLIADGDVLTPENVADRSNLVDCAVCEYCGFTGKPEWFDKKDNQNWLDREEMTAIQSGIKERLPTRTDGGLLEIWDELEPKLKLEWINGGIPDSLKDMYGLESADVDRLATITDPLIESFWSWWHTMFNPLDVDVDVMDIMGLELFDRPEFRERLEKQYPDIAKEIELGNAVTYMLVQEWWTKFKESWT